MSVVSLSAILKPVFPFAVVGVCMSTEGFQLSGVVTLYKFTKLYRSVSLIITGLVV